MTGIIVYIDDYINLHSFNNCCNIFAYLLHNLIQYIRNHLGYWSTMFMHDYDCNMLILYGKIYSSMPCLLLIVRLLLFLFGYGYDEYHNLYNLLVSLKLHCINMELSSTFNCKLQFYVRLWILQYRMQLRNFVFWD